MGEERAHNNKAPNLGEKKTLMLDRKIFGLKAPKPPSQILNRTDVHKRVRMSHSIYEDDATNYDYFEEDVDIDDLVIPSSNVDNLVGDDNSDGDKRNAKSLHVQIAKLEVEILTAKRALLRT